MQHVGEVLPAVTAGAQGTAPEAPAQRVVPAQLRAGEVVLAAMPPALPALPPELARAARWASLPDGAAPVEEVTAAGERVVVERPARSTPTPVPGAWKARAREPVERLRRILGPAADPRTIEAWVKRVVSGCSNPPTPDDARKRMAAIVFAVQGCPAICWTAASAQAAMQRWQWFPSPAEVFALAEEVARPYRELLAGLEAILAAPVSSALAREAPPEAPREKSPDEVAAVRAKAEAFLAGIRAPAPAAVRPARPVVEIPVETRIAILEQQIPKAATPQRRAVMEHRLALLRAQAERAA